MADPSSPVKKPGSSAPAAGGAAKGPSSFGEIDLGGDEGGTLDLDTGSKQRPRQEYDADELVDLPTVKKPPPASRRVPITYKQDGQAKPAPADGGEGGLPPVGGKPSAGQPATSRPTPSEQAAPERAQARPRPPRPAPPPEPKRSYAREIKIALIVILALGILGGGTWGILEWREGVRLAEEAQLKALDKGSLDSLKNDSLNKGKLGT